ncbi:MAG: LysM peptidoglycan-binding domain-containing protein [Victivallales bacterium]|nr:LysM peptidoglycan-binding domain-containing protein [Victivallales bacterium]
MDKRFAEVDQNWRTRMDALNDSIDKERAARRKELETVTNVLTTEIGKNNEANKKQETEVKSIVVQSGDTLSSIAKALKISVAELKKFNNLTDDRIYIGQKLQFPVK